MSHALLYVANSLESAPIPESIRLQSADVEHFVLHSFGIDDARRLSERAHLRSVKGGERCFLIQFSRITSEAQNALLKLFEEPPSGVVFHLVVTSQELLLPTLQSRLQLVASTKKTDSEDFTTFFDLSAGVQLNEIADRVKQKDEAWCTGIAKAAELKAQGGLLEGKSDVLQGVLLVQQYLGSRGASNKMLLEELVLSAKK